MLDGGWYDVNVVEVEGLLVVLESTEVLKFVGVLTL